MLNLVQHLIIKALKQVQSDNKLKIKSGASPLTIAYV
jgi:hypothetical protein